MPFFARKNLFRAVYHLDKPLERFGSDFFGHITADLWKPTLSWKGRFIALYGAIHVVSSLSRQEVRWRTNIKVFEHLSDVLSCSKEVYSEQCFGRKQPLVLIHAGVYHECAVVDRPFTIVAAAGDGAVHLKSNTELPVIKFVEGCGSAVLVNVFLEAEPSHAAISKDVFAVVIDGVCQPCLDHCSLKNSSPMPASACLFVRGSEAMPHIRKCVIGNCQCIGIIVEMDAKGQYESCEIVNTGQAGVWVMNGANPHFIDCRIHGAATVGVFVSQKGLGSFMQTEISHSTNSNVEVKCGSEPKFYHCQIHSGTSGGMFFTAEAKGLVSGCRIYENAHAGIWLSQHSSPTIVDNEICNGRQGGIYIFGGAHGVITRNNIYGNNMTNIQIRDPDTRPLILYNSIHHSQHGGIYAHDKAAGTIKGNNIFANQLAGVWVTTGASPWLLRNHIHHGKQVGIFFYDEGHGMVEDNFIYSNEYCGVQIRTGSNPTFLRNKIWGGGSSGVFIHEGGQGFFENNSIFENHNANVWIRGCSPVLNHNEISNSASVGIHITNCSRGQFFANNICSNHANGILVTTYSMPTLEQNKIRFSKGNGIEYHSGSGGLCKGNEVINNRMSGIAINTGCTVHVEGNVLDKNRVDDASSLLLTKCTTDFEFPLDYVVQESYICETCGKSENNHAICFACMRHCHSGHKIQDAGIARLRCACGHGLLPNRPPCLLIKEESACWTSVA